MKPIPLVRKAALAPAVSYLAAEGVPVHRYLGAAGLSDPLSLAKTSSVLHWKDLRRLWQGTLGS